MTFVLGAKSRKALKGVHPDLVRVVEHAITLSPIDFTVLEGLRSKEKQEQLVKAGASLTENSRHLTGHAVDLAALVNGEVRWDWNLYPILNQAMQKAAKQLSVPLEWGGNWRRLKDGSHFQLPWRKYP